MYSGASDLLLTSVLEPMNERPEDGFLVRGERLSQLVDRLRRCTDPVEQETLIEELLLVLRYSDEEINRGY